jgi:hypothetical protein
VAPAGLGVVVDGNVVGVAIATRFVKGDHHVGSLAADVGHDLAHGLVEIGLDQGIGVPVLRRVGHPRITIVEEEEVVNAQLVAGAAQLLFADLTQLLGRGQLGVADLAGLAARGTDQYQAHVGIGAIAGQCAANAERLVVGVGKDGHERERRVSGHAHRSATRCRSGPQRQPA